MRGRKKAAKRPLTARKAAVSRNGRGPAVPAPGDARLAEALAQQAATADILRIIAASRTDTQPVFDAIAESAARLCASYDAAIYRVEADRLVLAAHHGPIVLGRVGEFSLPVQGSVAGHAIRRRRAIQVADAQAVGNRYPVTSGHAPRMGVRTMLCVPLLLNGVAVGAFSLRRTEVQRFTTRQIALLRTFADQAVIAIENARLFHETQERNRDLTESLERETATSEILRVISSSPNDLQPGFDIIAKSAAVLCGAEVSAVTRFDGELIHMVAVYGSSRRGTDTLRKAFPLPPGGKSVSSRVIRDRAVTHIPDVLTEPEYGIQEAAVASGFRAALGVPMLRDGRAVGAIVVGRSKAGPFSQREIDLVRTFADQALIAIENARLFQEVNDRNRDLTESLERETATSEILRAISSSPNDLQPVFDIIARSAALLCGAEASTVARYDGELVHMVAIHGSSRRGVDALQAAFPRPPSGETASVRAIRDRAIVHIPDVLTDAEYGIQGAALASGFRSVLGVPMLRDGRALGAIALGRSKVGPFSNREIDLLRTFADQAVIAIENVRLFKELNVRNRDLTESLEQQTATGEILRVISSSPTDVQPVFETIVRNAVQLCDGLFGAVGMLDGGLLHLSATYNQTAEALATVHRLFPMPPDRRTLLGRAILDRNVAHVSSVQDDPAYDREVANVQLWRGGLAVPMIRDGAPIGAIFVARAEVGSFSDRQIDLLKTFADQAVIAIQNVRLFKELEVRNRDLTETLEQQTATGEILRVISGSPTDVQPVFDSIAESAAQLCGSLDSAIWRRDGDRLVLVAHHGSILIGAVGTFSLPLTRGTAAGQAVLESQAIHVADMQARADEFPDSSENARRMAFRTILVVPLMREGASIGAIQLRRSEVHLFTDRQVSLLQTFADQAVIAIENVRLFKELEGRNRDLTETLEQQTATGEILRVISSSPTDIQPVLDAVAENAARLCEATDAQIYRAEGDFLRLAASFGSIPSPSGRPINRGWVTGRAVVDRRTTHVHDLAAESDAEYPLGKQTLRQFGHRTTLATPLLREGQPLGAILIRRTEVRPFSERQITLLETFADQAVIAIENVRLFKELEVRNRDLTETLEQQTATGEILRVISGSPTDVQPVFLTIAQSARRLCGAEFCQVFRLENGQLHNVANDGQNAAGLEAIRRSFPRPPDRGTCAGRAVLEGAVAQIQDVEAEPDYVMAETARIVGFRSLLAVPIVRDGVAIGSIALGRAEAGAFPERQVELLKTFAEQAVIAIENVRLFKELEGRNRDLTDSLERQTATAEILRVISRSPTDVQPVFDIIGERARRLCDAEVSVVSRFDGDLLHLVSLHGVAPDGVATVRDAFPMRREDETISARSVRRRDVVHVADVLADPEYQQKGAGRAGGYRGCLAVPMMRDGQVIGSIFVARPQPGLFSNIQIELLKTFADQAVIAVQNVRLFNELEVRNRDLTETLEQQTATGEILRVISSSPTDVQPVFDSIARSAKRLLEAEFCFVFQYDGERIHFAAHDGLAPAGVDVMKTVWPNAPNRGSGAGRSILERRLVHIPDVQGDAEYQHSTVAEVAKFRSVLAVPMLRDGLPIGTITVNRPQAGPFSERQIELLKTFADQAVIAIQNVRLFKELEVRNRDLTQTLEQQTATGEILRVISSSPTDAQPVFDTIAHSASRLCDAGCFVFRFDGEKIHFVAQHGLEPDRVEQIRSAWPRTPTRGSASGRAVLDRAAVHIPDIVQDHEYELGSVAQVAAFRATVAIPILRDGVPIGAISLLRAEPGPFSDRHIELLRTFADQAVIAIENVRLFNELDVRNRDLTQTLEQQTATSEILRVISGSPTDVTPVFETIVERARRLCEADSATLLTYDGALVRLGAMDQTRPEQADALREAYPMPATRGHATGRAILTGRPVHIPDVSEDPEYALAGLRDTVGLRTLLSVPMIRAGQAIGGITVQRWGTPRPFSAKQIALLETFAEQAVIAIENTRLFNELEVRNRDLTETLEQQTATSEILRVISSSPTNVQPVFDTITQNAVRLCDGLFACVGMLEDGRIHIAATHNYTPEALEAVRRVYPMVPHRKQLLGRVILDRDVAHLPDIQADPDYATELVGHWRGALAVPMIRDGVPIGGIFVARAQVGAFSDRQIDLLKTFADQAVIAIENVRLFKELEVRNRDLTVTLEQQTATSEILRVISSSPTDVQPVFDTIAESAKRLCEAEFCHIFRFDGALLHFVGHHGLATEGVEAIRRAYPLPPGRASAAARAVLSGQIEQIPDVHADPDYAHGAIARLVTYRSIVGVPLLQEGRAIGAIAVARSVAGFFPERQLELLKTFADQAVIAIQNVRLFQELDARTQDLTRSVGELKALGEVSQAVSSTLDLETVLATIVSRAVQLSGSHSGIVYEFDEATETFHARATHEITSEHLEALRAAPIHLGEGAVGTAAAIQKPVQVPDIQDERQLVASQARAHLIRQGLRSLLAMPLIREGRLLGGLVILRREAGEFAPEVLMTMQTFAAQSVLAIQNARLFVEIQRQRQYAGTLVETSPVAITTVDAGGTVVGWNPAAVRLFGYTEAEAVGGRVEDLIGTPETREEIRGNINRILTGERLHAIGRRIRKDGSIVDVEMRSMPLIVDGTEVGFIATYHDITELLQARREAETANEAKGAFLATMSHEIRTPMNAVIGMSGLLLNTSLSAEQREYAEIVRQSGDTLLTVINDILDFSKIEAGRLELETQPFDLRECVEGALDLVATRAAEKGLDLAYLLGEGTPGAIVGDVTRLRQVLLNLLSNAVKFTERGEIVLSVTTRRPDGAGGLPELTFSVRDTGIGIPADRVGRLFQSFSQVDASTTRRYGGTGLGLAISQRLTELMGSHITVTSEVGVGSEFRFTLRAAPAAAPVPTRRDLTGVQPPLRGKRVLVVDDNATNRRILASHLEVWGMLARVTESPLEALGWLGGGERFDLGVLDMHMPEMDGVALAHAIRASENGPGMPLILFTSLGRREARAEEEGFAAYLHKPIKPSQLFDALISVLGDQPVHVPERGTVRTELDAEMATRHPLRLLLAEDNVVNQKVATRLLGQMGYRADIAANGIEAVAAVERQTYDVVLMDVQMPEMDGFEASREINRRWPSKRPRIVAMTANAMEGDRELCVAAGMDDYVAKPIRIEELVAALGRCRAREDAAPRPPAMAAPTAPAADVVDRAVIDRLGETMGRDFAVELIDTFVADARDLLAAIQRALAASDRDGFRRGAHTLKSTGESLGAFGLAALARELESIGQAGRLHEVGNRVDRLADLYERVAHALGAIRRDLSA
jgi:PAS domain S-box-containing protein